MSARRLVYPDGPPSGPLNKTLDRHRENLPAVGAAPRTVAARLCRVSAERPALWNLVRPVICSAVVTEQSGRGTADLARRAMVELPRCDPRESCGFASPLPAIGRACFRCPLLRFRCSLLRFRSGGPDTNKGRIQRRVAARARKSGESRLLRFRSSCAGPELIRGIQRVRGRCAPTYGGDRPQSRR